MQVVEFPEGIAIHGSFPDADVLSAVSKFLKDSKLPLTVADPPYGNIVAEKWDQVGETDVAYAAQMVAWSKVIEEMTLPGGAMYVWGGVGTPRRRKKSGGKGEMPPFRPFFRYLLSVELETAWRCSAPITWKKKRAYGIQWGYLFTREEVAYFVLGEVDKPHCFNVPLLEKKRGYEGYDKDHPAKSEFLRRANVWTDVADEGLSMQRTDVWEDVTEILRGKEHETQKPQRVMEIPIEVHTSSGETVFDPFAGHGTTAHAARKLGRRFVVVEKDPIEFDKMVAGLRK